MANIINGTDTGSGGLITTGDSSDELQLQTAETARVTLTNTAVVVNEDGNDVDFRVEGDTDANLLFVDAGNDRVGIGTSSPATKLHVNQTNDALPALQLQHNDGDFILMEEGGGTDIFKFTRVAATNDLQVNVITAANLRFATNNTERMRIDSSGNLLVGKTSSSLSNNGFQANASGMEATANADAGKFYVKTTNGGAGVILTYSNVGSTEALVGAGFANGTFGAVSDATKKKNVETARNYLQDIMSLRVVKYNWNTDEDGIPKELGWIAQEVEQVFPGMVVDMKGSKILKKEVFLPMLMKCIQELKAELDTVKAELATLKG